MANVTIDDLTTASTLDGTELLEIEQSGSSKKVTAALVAALGGGGGGGAGTVDTTGTPATNQIPIWVDEDTLKGTSGLTIDTNSNLFANNFGSGYATTATAAGVTTLTVASDYQQYFTGVTTQTCVLPVASTLALGHRFFIANISTGNVTVQSSGANEVVVLAQDESAMVTCILTSGTTAASWSVVIPQGAAPVGTLDASGTPVADQVAIWTDVNTLKGTTGLTVDSSSNVFANNMNSRYTSTATAATTTTLTVASAGQQYFTGSTTQTVVLPVTSTLTLGHQYYIFNASTGDVTVQSSGLAEIAVLAENEALLVTCILTSGTGIASWNAISTIPAGSVDIATDVAGLGTGVATALAINTNTSGGFPTTNGSATLTGKIMDTDSNTIRLYTIKYSTNTTLVDNECYGAVIYVDAACTITLPAISAGMNLTVITIGAVAVSVDPNTTQVLVLDGTALTGGHKATNLSTAGDIITLSYYAAGSWYAASNSWTDGG